MKRRRQGIVLLLLGLICLAGSAYFVLGNQKESQQAEAIAAATLDQFVQAVAEQSPPKDTPETAVVHIDGMAYIGVLEIPALGLTLPVAATLDYSSLKKAPCLYRGSYEDATMIIAGHNYTAHFGKLHLLLEGDEIIFRNVQEEEYRYQVAALETLSGTDTEKMLRGDWDLTLFTCTYGGAERVTVRCQAVTAEPSFGTMAKANAAD